jgi:hypothetical protein
MLGNVRKDVRKGARQGLDRDTASLVLAHYLAIGSKASRTRILFVLEVSGVTKFS